MIDDTKYLEAIDRMVQMLFESFMAFLMSMGIDNGEESAGEIFGVVVNAHMISLSKCLHFIGEAIRDEKEKVYVNEMFCEFMEDIRSFLKTGKHFCDKKERGTSH